MGREVNPGERLRAGEFEDTGPEAAPGALRLWGGSRVGSVSIGKAWRPSASLRVAVEGGPVTGWSWVAVEPGVTN